MSLIFEENVGRASMGNRLLKQWAVWFCPPYTAYLVRTLRAWFCPPPYATYLVRTLRAWFCPPPYATYLVRTLRTWFCRGRTLHASFRHPYSTCLVLSAVHYVFGPYTTCLDLSAAHYIFGPYTTCLASSATYYMLRLVIRSLRAWFFAPYTRLRAWFCLPYSTCLVLSAVQCVLANRVISLWDFNLQSASQGLLKTNDTFTVTPHQGELVRSSVLTCVGSSQDKSRIENYFTLCSKRKSLNHSSKDGSHSIQIQNTLLPVCNHSNRTTAVLSKHSQAPWVWCDVK